MWKATSMGQYRSLGLASYGLSLLCKYLAWKSFQKLRPDNTRHLGVSRWARLKTAEPLNAVVLTFLMVGIWCKNLALLIFVPKGFVLNQVLPDLPASHPFPSSFHWVQSHKRDFGSVLWALANLTLGNRTSCPMSEMNCGCSECTDLIPKMLQPQPQFLVFTLFAVATFVVQTITCLSYTEIVQLI